MTRSRLTEWLLTVLVCVATALLVLLAGIYGTTDWNWPL